MKLFSKQLSDNNITFPKTGFFKRHGIVPDEMELDIFERQSTRLRKVKSILEVVILALLITSGISLIFQSKVKVPVGAASLPGTFENFSIQYTDGAVALSWVGTSEKTADYYMILRSANGQTFIPAGMKTVQAMDPDGVFRFTDTHPFKGKSYYKMYRMELGGSAGYSQVKPISDVTNLFAVKKLFAGSFLSK